MAKTYKSAYQRIINMPSTDITKLSENELNGLLSEASRIANNRRANAVKQMEKHGIKSSIYADQAPYTRPEGGGNMSYRYVDFDFHPEVSLQEKQAKFAEIKRFLSAKTSTYAGIKRSVNLFRDTLTAGLHGGNLDKELRGLEVTAMNEGWSPKRLQREKEKLIKALAAQARAMHSDAERRLEALDDSDIVDLFWETYRRVREEKSTSVYGSDSVKDIIYQEVTDNPDMSGESLATIVKRRLDEEVYSDVNRAGHNSFKRGGGYRNGSNS